MCFKGGNGHDEWWCIMMGRRVWFVVQRGWRCEFYYQVSVMEKVMVCSECVLVIEKER